MIETSRSARIYLTSEFFRRRPNMTEGVRNRSVSYTHKEVKDEKSRRQGGGRRGGDARGGARDRVHAGRGGRRRLLLGAQLARAAEHGRLLRGAARDD